MPITFNMASSKAYMLFILLLASCTTFASMLIVTINPVSSFDANSPLDCRAIFSESIDDLPLVDARRFMSRVAKPPDLYTPHDPPLNWVAMGDSYTAGPGVGGRYETVQDIENCYRSKMSYPAQMEADFGFDTEQQLTFIACSGHKTKDVIEKQLSQIPDGPRQDFVIMTLGGNDALFSRIIKVCLLGIMGPGTTCDEVIAKAQEAIDDQGFTDRLHQVYDGCDTPVVHSL
jgi:hypothetical protein